MADALNELEQLEIDLLLEGVYRHSGHDFRGFQQATLHRRLSGLMHTYGLRTLSALQDRVLHDAAMLDALLRALAPQPAGLFEDTAYHLKLRALMATWLRSCPSPRIWVAECVAPEEVCALAILLEEEGLHERTQIFATAANDALLRQAREGKFSAGRFETYAGNYLRSGGRASLERYCAEEGDGIVFSAHLRGNITWAQHSLVSDASFNEFQLIACRNVIADFGSALRHRALQLFYESMPLLGILGVDQKEDVGMASFAGRYKPLSLESGLFQRVG